MSDQQEEQSKETLHQKPTHTKTYKLALILGAGVVVMLVAFSAAIHYTPLRFKSPVDPVDIAYSRLRSVPASGDIERAHYHISESNRILSEVSAARQAGGQYSNKNWATDLVSNNDFAVNRMLLAEAAGINLNDHGLVKRLCDSLGAQHAFLSGIDISDIPEEDKLFTRVQSGEALSEVYMQIQEQLETAMHW